MQIRFVVAILLHTTFSPCSPLKRSWEGAVAEEGFFTQKQLHFTFTATTIPLDRDGGMCGGSFPWAARCQEPRPRCQRLIQLFVNHFCEVQQERLS